MKIIFFMLCVFVLFANAAFSYDSEDKSIAPKKSPSAGKVIQDHVSFSNEMDKMPLTTYEVTLDKLKQKYGRTFDEKGEWEKLVSKYPEDQYPNYARELYDYKKRKFEAEESERKWPLTEEERKELDDALSESKDKTVKLRAYGIGNPEQKPAWIETLKEGAAKGNLKAARILADLVQQGTIEYKEEPWIETLKEGAAKGNLKAASILADLEQRRIESKQDKFKKNLYNANKVQDSKDRVIRNTNGGHSYDNGGGVIRNSDGSYSYDNGNGVIRNPDGSHSYDNGRGVIRNPDGSYSYY